MTIIAGGKKGAVGKINVTVDEFVEKDDVLANVETGKGNSQIKASASGKITEVLVSEGDEVSSNQLMFNIEEQASGTVKTEVNMTAIAGGKKGKIAKVNVKLGDKVCEGDLLANVETGKGNVAIKSLTNGKILEVLAIEGEEVASKDLMFVVESGCISSKEEKHGNDKKELEEVSTDLLVIGAGPGGYVAAIYAAKKGLNIIVVEKQYMGGTCLNVGCIPTKALVKSSEICHNVHNSDIFGVNVKSDIVVDMPRVIERKEEVRNKLVSGIDYLMEKNNITVLTGTASFVDNTTVKVTGEKNYKVKSKDIIIATGSKISKINIPGIDLPFVMNSTTALSCKELPETVTIIGGGVIGMEFACIYNNFGVDVHVVEFMDRLLTMVDKDVSKEIRDRVTDMGIKVYTSSKVLKIQESVDGKAVVVYEDENGENLVVSDKVLVAIGREPNFEGLNIDKTDIELNERSRGIAVDGHMKTNVDNIYAIGDITNIIQLAHVASHQGMVAVDNILGEDKIMHYTAVPNVIFTGPEIASVGMNEDECKEKEMDITVSKFNFDGNGKALTMNEPQGFIKLVKDNKNGIIVGGSIIGPDASSLISALTLCIANQFTENQIIETIFAHPTTGEVIHEAALELGIGALHQ